MILHIHVVLSIVIIINLWYNIFYFYLGYQCVLLTLMVKGWNFKAAVCQSAWFLYGNSSMACNSGKLNLYVKQCKYNTC